MKTKNLKEYKRLKYLEKRDKILKEAKIKYVNNRNNILKKVKEYQSKSDKPKKWRIKNKSYLNSKAYLWYKNNKDKSLLNQKIWRNKNKKYFEEWNKNNKDRVKIINKKFKDKLKREKPWIIAWRNQLWGALKRLNQVKNGKTINKLGYTPDELRTHIESLWVDGMNWKNYGRRKNCWEIDHSFPVSKFDKNTDMKIVNALSNLKPMWVTENRKKGNK